MSRLIAALGARECAGALAFAGALMGFEAWLFRPDYFTALFGPYNRITGTLAGWTGVGLSFASTAAYVWASLTATPRTRWAYLAVFAAIVALQYGYWSAWQDLVTADDLILAIWGTNVVQKRTMVLIYASWLAIVPCAAYALLLAVVPSRRRTGWKVLAGMLAALVVVNAPTLYPVRAGTLPLYALYPTTSINGFFRALAEVGWRWRIALRGGDREPVDHQAPAAPSNNVVLIVDESLRGDHLSLNGYPRATTPYLDDLAGRGLVTNWGIAVSGTNCSPGSNALLWTGFPPAELPALRGEIHRWPSLMQYAKAMGYRTHLLDGQMDTFWISSRGDLRYIDQWLSRREFPVERELDVDFALAARVAEIVDGSTGNFLWVNKAGVHYPYGEAFPQDRAIWLPSARGMVRPNEVPRETLVNSYDNAIRYNVDGFLARLDPPRRRPGTVIVYTSDHGQALNEHGEAWFHCGAKFAVPDRHGEVTVPLFMIEAGRPGRDPGRARDQASHANVFSTVLDLMGFPAERLHAYAPSLIGPHPFEPAPRYYFIGAIDEVTGSSRRLRFPG